MAVRSKFLSLVFPLTILMASQATSQVSTQVQTQSEGNVYIENSAKTQINGEGSAYSQVVTDVNGQRQEIESSQPGEIKVTVKDGQVETQINTTPTSSPSVFKISPIPQSQVEKAKRIWQTQFEQFINNFLRRILGLLKLQA